MSGGSLGGGSTTDALQQGGYPVVPNSAGGAQAMGAGANPQAQSLSQLQQALQKLGAGGNKSPAMSAAGMGQQMMQMGQQNQMRPQMPMQRPAGPAAPMQGAMPPQMMGGGMGQQMTPQMMNMLLARQNGLMGG